MRYGSRARSGQIRPSTGIESSEEWRSVAPKGVAFIYVTRVNEKMAAYLEALGFKVKAFEGLEQLYPDQCIDMEPEVSYDLGKRVFAKTGGADAILLSCAGMRTFECHEALETQTGVPVVTSNQASLWQALRMANVPDKIPSLGRLFREH